MSSVMKAPQCRCAPEVRRWTRRKVFGHWEGLCLVCRCRISYRIDPWTLPNAPEPGTKEAAKREWPPAWLATVGEAV
jgi:hypothetical protein